MARSRLAHGDSPGLLLVWERGRGITLTCTLTFVIGSAVDQVPWAQSINHAELLYHASFVLVRGQPPLLFFLPCEFVCPSLKPVIYVDKLIQVLVVFIYVWKSLLK